MLNHIHIISNLDWYKNSGEKSDWVNQINCEMGYTTISETPYISFNIIYAFYLLLGIVLIINLINNINSLIN